MVPFGSQRYAGVYPTWQPVLRGGAESIYAGQPQERGAAVGLKPRRVDVERCGNSIHMACDGVAGAGGEDVLG